MPMLRFKKPYQTAILAGRKTATLRRWRTCSLKTGDRVYAPGIGYLIMDAVDQMEWNALTQADAIADGFASLSDLDRAIRQIYPNLQGDGKSWFRLKFHLSPSSAMEQLASAVRAELDKAVRNNGS
jgi:hypothetical protein